MHVGFKIFFEDGTTGESHDEMWNEVKSHAHFLAPHCTKRWKMYQLITDDGQCIEVNFENGAFAINGVVIHPADEAGTPLTLKTDVQNFPVSPEWQQLNGMPYFPVVGKRIVRGELWSAEISFCGWKRKESNKTIEKVCYLYNNVQKSQVITGSLYTGAIVMS